MILRRRTMDLLRSARDVTWLAANRILCSTSVYRRILTPIAFLCVVMLTCQNQYQCQHNLGQYFSHSHRDMRRANAIYIYIFRYYYTYTQDIYAFYFYLICLAVFRYSKFFYSVFFLLFRNKSFFWLMVELTNWHLLKLPKRHLYTTFSRCITYCADFWISKVSSM